MQFIAKAKFHKNVFKWSKNVENSGFAMYFSWYCHQTWNSEKWLNQILKFRYGETSLLIICEIILELCYPDWNLLGVNLNKVY